MKLANFKIEQLKVLPLRASVAFATRCARRVEHLAQLPEGDPHAARRREAVAYVLSMAEAFAGGSEAPLDESFLAAADAIRDAGGDAGASTAVSAVAQAAHAAASAWHASLGAPARGPGGQRSAGAFSGVTADLAAMSAFTAAADAFISVGYRNEEFVDAALADYHKLVGLKLGRYPDLGTPIDPSPDGPLGPL